MSFPFEKMWSFQSVEHQIAQELSYFNWYQVVQEPQKAMWAFANLLMKLIYAPPNRLDLEIDRETAQSFLTLYFGNGGQDPVGQGLYALDVIQREFEGEYVVLCRGYKDMNLDPAGHHQMVMLLYQKMLPLLWELWHQIADQIDTKGGDMLQLRKWLEEREGLPTEEEIEAQLLKEGLIRMDPVKELLEVPE